MQNMTKDTEAHPFTVAAFKTGCTPEPISTWEKLEPACLAAFGRMKKHPVESPEFESAVVIDLRTGKIWPSDWILSHVGYALDLFDSLESQPKSIWP